MLESLTIHNFQANRHLHVDLEQITNIIGMSDSGKTAILRALYWLSLNNPSGTDFISWGEEKVRVSAVFDGREIVRKAGKTGNLYILDGNEYRAFGTNIPADIVNVLNIDEGSFQMQEDQRFWLCETPGNVAKELNQIVNLEVIDKSLDTVAKACRQVKSESELIGTRLAEHKKTELELKWVTEADAALSSLEMVSDAYVQESSKIVAIAASIEKAMVLTTWLQEAAAKAGALHNAVTKSKEAWRIADDIHHLENTIKTAVNLKKTISLKELAKQISEKSAILIWAKEELKKAEVLISAIQFGDKKARELKKSAIEAHAQLHAASIGLCPVCGKEMLSI